MSLSFSPTGGTRRAADIFCEALHLPVGHVDLCREHPSFGFGSGDLAVVAVPVYGGRVPAPAIGRLSEICGAGVPAVLVAVYGNRDYDDALTELNDVALQCGFIPVAAAALLAEHSIFRCVGSGRPDGHDAGIIAGFARRIEVKLRDLPDVSAAMPLHVNGTRPYKEYGGVPLRPRVTGDCDKCGACAVGCPVGAIPHDAPDSADNAKCIACMRCISICPRGAREINVVSGKLWRFLPFAARYLNRRLLAASEKKFAAANAARREPELFL